MHRKIDYCSLLAIIIVSSIFGFSFVFTKEGLDVLEPLHLLGLRFGLAIIIFEVLRICGIIKLDYEEKNLRQLAILTFIQPVLYFICETLGIQMTSSSEAAIIIALSPVFTVISAAIYLKERPTAVQTGFILLSVAGVIFMTAMKGNIQMGSNIIGTIILLGSVFSAGVYRVISRKMSSEFSSVEITYAMVLVGAIVFNGMSFFQHIKSGTLNSYFTPLSNPKALLSVVYLGVLSSIVAYFLLNYLLSRIEASRVSVISNLTTIISVIAGALIRNESLYWFNVIGGLMILCGVWGTNYFHKRDTVQKASQA